jgi:hypothetical protein
MSSTNLVKKNLFTKPYLLTLDEISQIGQNMNLVGYDPQLNITSDDTNIVLKYGVPSSPKILNWVEPYTVAGIDYTLFYTEVNSGLNIGDRVFIINGTYDSNLLIQADKYKKGHDGYKVLFIDKCKVVLDIEFVGSLPSNETTENTDDFDDFIKVYYVKDDNDFLHVNRQITTRVSANTVDFKFNQNQNNLVFTDTDFNPIGDLWGVNDGLFGAPGFFIKDGSSAWINISSDFMAGSYSIAATNSNNKILILNNSFTYNGFEFKENSIYSWEYNPVTATYNWTVNVKHENNNVPILTKSNFRDGTFNGNWNGGLYGSNEKRITWGSTTSLWNHGTLLNTIWEKGIMESKYSQTDSYISEFDAYGLPYQKSTNPDNDGYGYNFVINSEIRNAVINNGNVSNSILLGTGSASNISIVEDHVRGNLTDQYIRDNFNSTLIKKAYFESCGIQNSNIENSIIKNSRVSNSRIYSVKSINTHYKSSLFKNSNYISDNIIKVLDFDEFEYSTSSGTTHLVYKFYINKRSYEKFKFKDNFYIKGIKLNSSYPIFSETEPVGNTILNFFDKKFKLGPWTEYIDTNVNNLFDKQGIRFNSFVSTPKENQYEYYVNGNNNETGLVTNSKGYSLDIFVELNTFTAPGINETSISYKNTIDFSNAYIQNSDFESGIVENSNWNSGHHINYNYVNNLGKTASNQNSVYDISLAQSSIGITSSLVLNSIILNDVNQKLKDEVELDYLKVNDIVFLNAVDYDSRGTVTSVSISKQATGYFTSNNVSTTSYTGNGIGLQVDIVASVIGGVLTLLHNGDGNGFTTDGIYSVTGGSGADLELNIIHDGSGYIQSYTINNIGFDYSVGDIVTVTGAGVPATFNITSISNGQVVSANVSLDNNGLFYEIGDIINVGNGNAQIQITGVTGSLTRLPDTYKVTCLDPFIVDEIYATASSNNSVINALLQTGVFSSYGAENRYGYLHKTKFYKSKIVSGLFRRAYLKGSLVKNDTIDISDKDFTNITKLKSLIIADTIFSKNDNILSNAFYIFSSFVSGTDIWDNGILFRSIWNGMTFNNGLVRESTWLDGKFLNGLFYLSSQPTAYVEFGLNLPNILTSYKSNNILSYYRSGDETVDNNDRLSWQKGTFVNGEFYKSKWEDGEFNGGKFYYSDFYSGTINGGIIGDKSLSSYDTNVYNGSINYTTVENANLTANYTNSDKNIDNTINWYNGVFNDGVFNTHMSNSATWYYGTFNGGEFGDHSFGTPKWKNGIFNGGKFTSVYGTSSGTSSGIYLNTPFDDISSYAWEDGVFNNGEFGFGDLGNSNSLIRNSSWFNGTFNGGKFKGKVWNNGIFTFGEFFGSGYATVSNSGSAIGGTASDINYSNPNSFVQSFINSGNLYYGLWRNGFITDTKSKYLNEEIFTELKRNGDNKTQQFTLLKNVLWLSGTFSHPSGTIQNSVWLDGEFINGNFDNSAFNPYVKRLDNTIGFNFNNSCKWTNGIFNSGEFSISNWENGKFISGTATGMIWKNGIVNYMNAYNVFWEDGLWRNGNWQGSFYNINQDGSVTDPYVKQVLDRGMSWSGTSSCHIWSVFYKESLTKIVKNFDEPATNVTQQLDSSEPQSPLAPTQFGLVNSSTSPTLPNPSTKQIGSIAWDSGGSADLVGTYLSVVTLFTSVDTYNSITWEVYSGTTWTTGTAITLPFTGISKQFNLQPGVNKFRVKGTNPDNNQIYYTNVLTYTKTVPAYTIAAAPGGLATSTNITTTTGEIIPLRFVTVTTAPVNLTLSAVSGNSQMPFTLYNARGQATVELNNMAISGSPFDTDVAIGGGTKTKTITLSFIGTYEIGITAQINGSGGYVNLT